MHGAPETGEDIVRAARIDEGADPGRNDRETRVTWAAGFFDGEGTVSLTESKNGNWSVRLSVGQLVREPLDTFASLWGGSICEDRSGPKTMHKWAAMANKGAAALREMLPYLIVKRQQAQIALEFHDGKKSKPKKTREQKRETLTARMRAWRDGTAFSVPRYRVPDSEKERGALYIERIRAARP